MNPRPAQVEPSSHDTCAAESGQATLIGIGIAFAAIALGMILLAVGRVYIAQAELQQAADIAATSLSQARGDDPVAHARALARANGAREISFTTEGSRRVLVATASAPRVLGMVIGAKVTARAVVMQSLAGSAGAGTAVGTQYSGSLVSVDAATLCPAVAADYRAMQSAAAVSGVRVWAVSGYRTVAEQAVLYAQLGPGIAAAPGTSLHHAATELDLATGPAGSPVHRWLSANASRFNFIQRYSWEPWHWGNVRGC